MNTIPGLKSNRDAIALPIAGRRFESLDGLRGFAALVVVVSHFFTAYAPTISYERTVAGWWGADTPLEILYNGAFAVSVFYVLSGFVVAHSVAQRHLPIWFNVGTRYLRLALPALGGTLFGWCLLKLIPHGVSALIAAHDHDWLHAVYNGREPGFWWAVQDGLIGIFLHGGSMFNNVLWTMKIELVGSVIIYLLYAVSPQRFRSPLLIATMGGFVFLAHRPNFACFAVGALFRERKMQGKLPNSWSWIALVFGIFFGAMTHGYGERMGLPPALRILGLGEPMLALGEPNQIWAMLAATAILYAVLGLPTLERIFSSAAARFLGAISFGLYLVHVPLLYTVFVQPYLLAQNHFGAMAGLLGLFLCSSLVLGWVFTLLIDRRTLALLRLLRRRCFPPLPTGLLSSNQFVPAD